MKKLIISLVILMLSVPSCFADDLFIDREAKYQKKVMEIGFRILNANQIEKRMTFYYAPSKNVNAVTYLRSKQIAVYKGLLPFLDSDDEIAAILSHEISHGIDAHKGYWRRLTQSAAPRSFEFKSDKRGIDLMVNAGYNPLAMIIALNKICGEPNWFELYQTHPNGSERLMTIYQYIYEKYPEYLVENEYKNNIYYQNFLLTTKEKRKAMREYYAKKNNIQVNNQK